jgi:outer membrane receptor protein involved in Fe transport
MRYHRVGISSTRRFAQTPLCLGSLGVLAPAALAAPALEEIVVTATRYATELQTTPLSVSALTGEMLRRQGTTDIVEWFARAPGLNYTDDGWGGHRTTFRGITSGNVVEPRPLSAWYLDDVPMITISGSAQLGQIGGPHPLAIDLARIEVLRGPQGMLFGSNALGGAVRMITNAPDPGEFAGWVDAGVSTTEHGGDNYEASVVLNVPIAKDRAALRVVGYRQDFGGYIDNTARAIRDIDSGDTTGGRLSLLWQVSPDLDIELKALGQRRTADGISSADVAVGPYQQHRPAPEQDVESWELFALSIDYDLPWARLTSSTSYADRQPRRAFDITSLTANFPEVGFTITTANDYDDGVRDFVQELRLVSAAESRLSWVTGAYYQAQDRSLEQNWLSPGFDAVTGGDAAAEGYPDSPWHAEYDSSLRQRAIYGELAYELTPAWRATIGARWFDFTDDLDEFFGGLLATGLTEVHADYRESGVTPRLGLEYRASERLLMYLTAAAGFRPGGANEFTADVLEACQQDLDELGTSFPTQFDSDSLWNYEVGARMRGVEDRLAANISVYHIDWEDMQTAVLLPSCGISVVDNIGRAASDGVELEVAWLPLDSLELGLSASYVDARLAEDVPSLQAEDGERIPTVPEWTISATARQDFQLTSTISGYAQADYQYVDGAWNGLDATTRVRVPSRQLVNLRTGTKFDRWELELYVNNLFDERGVLYHNNALFNWQVLVRPRTAGLRARLAL